MEQERISLEQVRHVARLARLALTPAEEQRLQIEMSEMLDYVDKLNQLNTEDVGPTAQVGEPGITTREDEVTNPSAADAMLANAPARDGFFFKVPKIIE
ncbi:MAG TPA: Asp-tRNA(Asn)/Glu-tRNA(Gln) amidotransferase subunit GatC [Candidatus Binataceae bacterium]|nr:Asp-tRNA(Asn)/Glu-tRNA(Gln) amidotransferase subunit GatC [Candidatus Binataceae bacterium]